jgi:hypothetical protein
MVNIEGYSRDTTVNKDCKHTFNNDKTNTIFHYLHAQLYDWFIAIYLSILYINIWMLH